MKYVCDFCYSPEPVWEYHIPKGMLRADLGDGTDLVDSGEWFACEDCAKRIETGDTLGLVMRAMNFNPAIKRLEFMSPKWLLAAANASLIASIVVVYGQGRVPVTGGEIRCATTR